jgi:hypothetical protein
LRKKLAQNVFCIDRPQLGRLTLDIQQYTQSIVERLQASASVKTIYGEPVAAEGKTIIPVARVAYGFGAGSGSGGKGEAEEAGESFPQSPNLVASRFQSPFSLADQTMVIRNRRGDHTMMQCERCGREIKLES